MIAIFKFTNELFRKVKIENNGMIGLFKYENSGLGTNFPKEQVDLYYSESELQQKIESAVAEDRKLNSESLEKVMINGDKEITDLRMQVEELKAKVPQPVEISHSLYKIINLFKRRYGSTWEWNFINEEHTHWIPDEFKKGYNELSILDALKIIKNGYIPKRETALQDRMERLLKSTEYHGLAFEVVAEKMANVLKKEGWVKDEEA